MVRSFACLFVCLFVCLFHFVVISKHVFATSSKSLKFCSQILGNTCYYKYFTLLLGFEMDLSMEKNWVKVIMT